MTIRWFQLFVILGLIIVLLIKMDKIAQNHNIVNQAIPILKQTNQIIIEAQINRINRFTELVDNGARYGDLNTIVQIIDTISLKNNELLDFISKANFQNSKQIKRLATEIESWNIFTKEIISNADDRIILHQGSNQFIEALKMDTNDLYIHSDRYSKASLINQCVTKNLYHTNKWLGSMCINVVIFDDKQPFMLFEKPLIKNTNITGLLLVSQYQDIKLEKLTVNDDLLVLNSEQSIGKMDTIFQEKGKHSFFVKALFQQQQEEEHNNINSSILEVSDTFEVYVQ